MVLFLQAGYYNTNQNNAYLLVADTFAKYGATMDFTCLEMFDSSSCGSEPQELVKQAIQATQSADILFDGENAVFLFSGVSNSLA